MLYLTNNQTTNNYLKLKYLWAMVAELRVEHNIEIKWEEQEEIGGYWDSNPNMSNNCYHFTITAPTKRLVLQLRKDGYRPIGQKVDIVQGKLELFPELNELIDYINENYSDDWLLSKHFRLLATQYSTFFPETFVITKIKDTTVIPSTYGVVINETGWSLQIDAGYDTYWYDIPVFAANHKEIFPDELETALKYFDMFLDAIEFKK